MVRDAYEITVVLENGDWISTQLDATLFDFHRAAATGLDFALQHNGKLISVQKIGATTAPPSEGSAT